MPETMLGYKRSSMRRVHIPGTVASLLHFQCFRFSQGLRIHHDLQSPSGGSWDCLVLACVCPRHLLFTIFLKKGLLLLWMRYSQKPHCNSAWICFYCLLGIFGYWSGDMLEVGNLGIFCYLFGDMLEVGNVARQECHSRGLTLSRSHAGSPQ